MLEFGGSISGPVSVLGDGEWFRVSQPRGVTVLESVLGWGQSSKISTLGSSAREVGQSSEASAQGGVSAGRSALSGSLPMQVRPGLCLPHGTGLSLTMESPM